MNYSKPPINILQQIDLLKKRGLIFEDEAKAAHYLSNISYYRLRAYTYPFQDNTKASHPFKQKVTFEKIIEMYVFDRKLRMLVFDAIEKIEIALRTKIVYHLALSYGSHWYENGSLYYNQNRFIRDINKLYKEVDRSTETFIRHYKAKYTFPPNPPAWMSMEVTSLGMLSMLFENLKKNPEKKAITNAFGLKSHIILESWMHTFAYLRNICAHHSRLWNRRLTTTLKLPTDTLYPFLKDKNIYTNKLYSVLCCITYVLDIISPGNDFNRRLFSLMNTFDMVDLREMGFPVDWQDETIWNTENK